MKSPARGGARSDQQIIRSGCHRLQVGWLRQPQHIVGCLLRLRSRYKDSALVGPQDLQPGLDVASRVLELTVDSAVRTEKCGTDLGDQLFGGIRVAAETLSKLPVAATRVTAPMCELVQSRGIKIFARREPLPRRPVDLVGTRLVI